MAVLLRPATLEVRLDTEALDTEKIEALEQILPNEDETKKLESYTGELTELRDIEVKLLPFITISRPKPAAFLRQGILVCVCVLPASRRDRIHGWDSLRYGAGSGSA